MGYRRNVTDKDQTSIERQADGGGIRFPWFNGRTGVGETKTLKAYDLSAQAESANGVANAKKMIPNSGSGIGSHNDKPFRFDNPGKA